MEKQQLKLLKLNFIQNLVKFGNKETQQAAYKTCKQLILTNKTKNGIRVFLSCFQTNHIRSNVHIEYELRTLIFIIRTFGHQLLDPIDQIPSILDTAQRVLKIIFGYFGAIQNSFTMHAAFQSILSVLEFLIDGSEILEQIEYCIYPLISLYTNLDLVGRGENIFAQKTASYCILEFLKYYKRQLNPIIYNFEEKVLNLILKKSDCLSELIECFNIYVENSSKVLLKKLDSIVLVFIRELNSNNHLSLKSIIVNSLYLVSVKLSFSQQLVKNFYQQVKLFNQSSIIDLLETMLNNSQYKTLHSQIQQTLQSWKDTINQSLDEIKKDQYPKIAKEKQNQERNSHKLQELNKIRDLYKIKKQRSFQQYLKENDCLKIQNGGECRQQLQVFGQNDKQKFTEFENSQQIEIQINQNFSLEIQKQEIQEIKEIQEIQETQKIQEIQEKQEKQEIQEIQQVQEIQQINEAIRNQVDKNCQKQKLVQNFVAPQQSNSNPLYQIHNQVSQQLQNDLINEVQILQNQTFQEKFQNKYVQCDFQSNTRINRQLLENMIERKLLDLVLEKQIINQDQSFTNQKKSCGFNHVEKGQQMKEPINAVYQDNQSSINIQPLSVFQASQNKKNILQDISCQAPNIIINSKKDYQKKKKDFEKQISKHACEKIGKKNGIQINSNHKQYYLQDSDFILLKRIQAQQKIDQTELFKNQKLINFLFENQVTENLYINFFDSFIDKGFISKIDRSQKIDLLKMVKDVHGDEYFESLKFKIQKKIEYS